MERVWQATHLAGGRELVCGVHDGGRVSCWRVGNDGVSAQHYEAIAAGAERVFLGRGMRGEVRGSRHLHDPSIGGEHGCAMMLDRTVQCWGSNLRGELGDGSLVASDSPVGVAL